MSVLFTIAVLAALAMWGIAVHTRLVRLRSQVKKAWKTLDIDRGNADARHAYNGSVSQYNAALQAFPANAIAGLAGFHPAKRFESKADG